MAAQNAHNRALALYERQFNDNSPENQKKRLEEAGLSTALMYGQTGSTGSAEMGTGQQGGAGGPSAGNAAGNNAALGMAAVGQAMTQQKLVQSQEELNKSQAIKNLAEAEQAGSQAKTTEALREDVVAKMKADITEGAARVELMGEQKYQIMRNIELMEKGLNEQIRHNTKLEEWQKNALIEDTRHNKADEAIAWYQAVTGRKLAGNAITRTKAETELMGKQAEEIERRILKDIATGETREVKVSKEEATRLGIAGAFGTEETQTQTVIVFVSREGEVTYQPVELESSEKAYERGARDQRASDKANKWLGR